MTAATAADGPPAPARRPPLWTVAGVALLVVALYAGLPQLVGGLDRSWGRIASGDPVWLCAAALLEIGSYAAYVAMFYRLVGGPGTRIGRRASYDIALAGVVASRLLATAGAGGIALTAWALDRSGMERRDVVSRLTTFYVTLYGCFMVALVVTGAGLRTGILDGRAPAGLTVVPAAFGAALIVAALLAARSHERLGRWAQRASQRRGRGGRALAAVMERTATVAVGVRGAVSLLGTRNRAAVLQALGWWGFDIGVLWACFLAFGEAPPGGVIVMAYFIGMLGNLLPLPGGVGGVEGAMIGAFLGFGVDDALAVTAVLSYRAIAYWLPTIPGVLAYLHLLRTVSGWERDGQRTPVTPAA